MQILCFGALFALVAAAHDDSVLEIDLLLDSSNKIQTFSIHSDELDSPDIKLKPVLCDRTLTIPGEIFPMPTGLITTTTLEPANEQMMLSVTDVIDFDMFSALGMDNSIKSKAHKAVSKKPSKKTKKSVKKKKPKQKQGRKAHRTKPDQVTKPKLKLKHKAKQESKPKSCPNHEHNPTKKLNPAHKSKPQKKRKLPHTKIQNNVKVTQTTETPCINSSTITIDTYSTIFSKPTKKSKRKSAGRAGANGAGGGGCCQQFAATRTKTATVISAVPVLKTKVSTITQILPRTEVSVVTEVMYAPYPLTITRSETAYVMKPTTVSIGGCGQPACELDSNGMVIPGNQLPPGVFATPIDSVDRNKFDIIGIAGLSKSVDPTKMTATSISPFKSNVIDSNVAKATNTLFNAF